MCFGIYVQVKRCCFHSFHDICKVQKPNVCGVEQGMMEHWDMFTRVKKSPNLENQIPILVKHLKRHSKLLVGCTPSEGVGYKLPYESDGIPMCQDQQREACPNIREEMFSVLKSIEM